MFIKLEPFIDSELYFTSIFTITKSLIIEKYSVFDQLIEKVMIYIKKSRGFKRKGCQTNE